MPIPPQHRQQLIKQLKSTQSLLNALGKKKELDKIIEMIRIKKGWTTPAEYQFTLNATFSIAQRLEQLSGELSSLYSAASKVQSKEV